MHSNNARFLSHLSTLLISPSISNCSTFTTMNIYSISSSLWILTSVNPTRHKLIALCDWVFKLGPQISCLWMLSFYLGSIDRIFIDWSFQAICFFSFFLIRFFPAILASHHLLLDQNELKWFSLSHYCFLCC